MRRRSSGYNAIPHNEEVNLIRPSEVHILRTPIKVFTTFRNPLLYPKDISPESVEAAIKKVAEDYRTAFNQDKKAARNFLFMCARDILIGIGVALFTAELRRPDTPDAPNISNILIVSLTILSVFVALLKEILDVRTEFDKNYSSQQKAILDAEGHLKKINQLQSALEEARNTIKSLERSVTDKVNEIDKLTSQKEALEIQLEESKQQATQLNKIQATINSSSYTNREILVKTNILIGKIDDKISPKAASHETSPEPQLKRSHSCPTF